MRNRVSALVLLLWTFARVRWGLRFRSRQDLLAWQQRRLNHFLHGHLGRIPFYAGRNRQALQQLPVVHKAHMLAQFEQFNAYGLGLQEALAVAQHAEQARDFRAMLPGGVAVGLSSGTSGQRGVFLVSPRERSVWAGTLLARLLTPQALRQVLNPFRPPLRVAFLLRANSHLYETVNSTRLRFVYLDLQQPLPEQLSSLNALQPQVLIAPASVLHQLARQQQPGTLQIAPDQVVSVAEVLESDDAQIIFQAWGRRVEQVYQCTEGFLAVTCAQGRMHLNEEFIHIEPQWLDAQKTRFTPLVTDFSRRTQAFVRFALDDVLQVEPGPCPCGRVTLSLLAVQGRCDDLLWLLDRACGTLRPVFADSLRRAMWLAQSSGDADDIEDYRLAQNGVQWQISLKLAGDAARAQMRVKTQLAILFEQLALAPPPLVFTPWIEPADLAGTKRRRIRCLVKPASALHKESRCKSS